MALAKRISLFILVNILIVATFSIPFLALDMSSYLAEIGIDWISVILSCALYGIIGSILSLMLSKFIAKNFCPGINVIESKDQLSEKERLLLSTVHRLSHKAGIKRMPEVGIYKSNDINAFATGWSANYALVGVSAGLLKSMNEDELEGVIAHEISHITRGDMVTLALIQGMILMYTYFLSYVIGFVFIALSLRKEKDKNKNGQSSSPGFTFFGMSFIRGICNILFTFIAKIVAAFFSRRRELSADREGAKLVGNGNMLKALLALKQNEDSLVKEFPSLSPFKISGKARTGIGALFATHPPLSLRISTLSDEKTQMKIVRQLKDVG